MTEELPKATKAHFENAVFCEKCNQVVRLTRNETYQTLAVECACGERRQIKLATTLPDSW